VSSAFTLACAVSTCREAPCSAWFFINIFFFQYHAYGERGALPDVDRNAPASSYALQGAATYHFAHAGVIYFYPKPIFLLTSSAAPPGFYAP